MNKKIAILTAAFAIAVASALAASGNPMVGGQEIFPAKKLSRTR